jgi:hypothetical protein
LNRQHTGSSSAVLALLCVFIAVACQGSKGTQEKNLPTTIPTSGQLEVSSLNDSPEERILHSFLVESDLPLGWFRSYFGREEVEGKTEYGVDFKVSDQPELDHIVVTQVLSAYADEAQATEAFQKRWSNRMSLGQAPREIDFESRADDFAISCLYSTIAMQPYNFCTAVARYDRLISVLMTKTWDQDDEEQWFTWEDFEKVLTAMDRRALEATDR